MDYLLHTNLYLFYYNFMVIILFGSFIRLSKYHLFEVFGTWHGSCPYYGKRGKMICIF